MFRVLLARYKTLLLLLVLCFLNLFSVYVLFTSKSVLAGGGYFVPPGNFANGVLSIVLFVVMLGIAILICQSRHEGAFETLTILLALSFFYWLYFHSSSQGTYQFLDYRQGAYYDELAKELRSGTLGITNNGQPMGADWSFYGGVNYLYFPPFPSILQKAINLIFGITVSFHELTLVFSILNLALFYVLLRDLSSYFDLGLVRNLWIRLTFLLAYGFGWLYMLASRYFVYETGIIFGSTFLLSSTVMFLRYYNAKPRSSVGSKALFACNFGVTPVYRVSFPI